MSTCQVTVVAPKGVAGEAFLSLLDAGRFAPVAVVASSGEAVAVVSGNPAIGMAILCSDREAGAVEELVTARPDLRVVVVAPTLDAQEAIRLLSAGAHGYLLERMTPVALSSALDLIRLGETIYPGELAGRLLDNCRPYREYGLTGRECEVLRMLTCGTRDREIAQAIGISQPLVKSIVRGLRVRLGAENRTQLALWGCHHGFGPAERSRVPAAAVAMHR